jgi:hypothetical protein
MAVLEAAKKTAQLTMLLTIQVTVAVVPDKVLLAIQVVVVTVVLAAAEFHIVYQELHYSGAAAEVAKHTTEAKVVLVVLVAGLLDQAATAATTEVLD